MLYNVSGKGWQTPFLRRFVLVRLILNVLYKPIRQCPIPSSSTNEFNTNSLVQRPASMSEPSIPENEPQP